MFLTGKKSSIQTVPKPPVIKIEGKRKSSKHHNLLANIPWLATIWTDFQIIFERDPAANNWLEVVLCYPGVHALVLHRLAQLAVRISELPCFPDFYLT